MDLVKDMNEKIDGVERMMLESGNLIEAPLIHKFTPNMYIREVFMPKGSMLTSKVHKTEHPFVVLTGVAVVATPEGETEVLAAGHSGITKPNTRRVLFIEADCRWVTFHPLSEAEEDARANGLEEEDLVNMIEGRIIEQVALPDGEKSVHQLYKEKLEGDKTCLM